MTEKQLKALDKIISILPENCQEIYRDIAEYAISLGYMPTIKGAGEQYADFSKSKVKRTILKIDSERNECDGIVGVPQLAMKFFACSPYSTYFLQGIEYWIALYKKLGYTNGCRSCGKCDGTHGYTYLNQESTHIFICGMELLPLPSVSNENVAEIKDALKTQDDFFMSQFVT